MKQAFLLGAMLLASFSVQAQANKTGKGSSATNSTNASTVGSAATNNPDAIGNNRPGRGQSENRKVRNTGSTVDGSNGSATNDGASGESGSPAPLPSFSARQTKNNATGKMKRSSGKMSRTLKSSSGRIGGQP